MWAWSDAWLLTAAYFTGENPVSLRALIAAGDAINHAIFMDSEIDDGLARLEAAGLTRLDGDSIVLTDDAIRLCGRAVKSTGYMFEATEKVEAELRQIDLSDKELQPVEVSKTALAAAIDQYHEDAAREIAELRAADPDS